MSGVLKFNQPKQRILVTTLIFMGLGSLQALVTTFYGIVIGNKQFIDRYAPSIRFVHLIIATIFGLLLGALVVDLSLRISTKKKFNIRSVSIVLPLLAIALCVYLVYISPSASGYAKESFYYWTYLARGITAALFMILLELSFAMLGRMNMMMVTLMAELIQIMMLSIMHGIINTGRLTHPLVVRDLPGDLFYLCPIAAIAFWLVVRQYSNREDMALNDTAVLDRPFN